MCCNLRPTFFRLLHQENQWGHCQEEPAQQQENMVEGQHGGLLLHHSKDRAVSLAGCCDRVHSPRNQCGPYALQDAAAGEVVGSDIGTQDINIALGISSQKCGYGGNPYAATNITHQVEDAGGIAHLFLSDWTVSNCG